MPDDSALVVLSADDRTGLPNDMFGWHGIVCYYVLLPVVKATAEATKRLCKDEMYKRYYN